MTQTDPMRALEILLELLAKNPLLPSRFAELVDWKPEAADGSF